MYPHIPPLLSPHQPAPASGPGKLPSVNSKNSSHFGDYRRWLLRPGCGTGLSTEAPEADASTDRGLRSTFQRPYPTPTPAPSCMVRPLSQEEKEEIVYPRAKYE